MKVRELQQQLNKLDPELTILCCTEDAKLLSAATPFRLLDIEEITTAHGELVRLDDGTPYLKLGNGSGAEPLATLVVTTAF
jgi:hypothetical protein